MVNQSNSGKWVSLPLGLCCALSAVSRGERCSQGWAPGALKDPTVSSFPWAAPGWGEGQFRGHWPASGCLALQ